MFDEVYQMYRKFTLLYTFLGLSPQFIYPIYPWYLKIGQNKNTID